jgi:hypothetical protein
MSLGTRTWGGPGTGRSPTSSPTAAWSVPSPAPSPNRPSTGCAEHAPEPPDRPGCPARSPSHDGSVRGAIMIGGQRIQAGPPHAGQTASITTGSGTCQITVPERLTMTAPRATSRDILRHKASNYQQ